MQDDWLLDEQAYAGPEHLDAGFVVGYDRKQGYPDPAPDLDVFAAYGLDANAVLIDFGAGTGQFALAAAAQAGQVIAVDISPVMLQRLRARAAETGRTNLQCVQAGLLSYVHEGTLVAGIYTRNALHHLPDFWKALALNRIARLVQPGGVLRLHDLIYDFQPANAAAVFDRWLSSAAHDPVTG